MRAEPLLALAMASLAVSQPAEVRLGGEAVLVQRSHWNSSIHPGSSWNRQELRLRPELVIGQEWLRFEISPRWQTAREDEEARLEPGSTHASLRLSSFCLDAGWTRTRWGAMDAVSITDIVDPVNWTDPFEESARIERLVVRAGLHGERLGSFQAAYHPWFPDYPVPGSGQRLQAFPLPTRQVVAEGAGRGTPSFSGRWTRSWSALDVALVAYHGVARDPVPELSLDYSHLRLVHPRMTAAGGEATAALGAVILRGEGLWSRSGGRDDLAFAGGGEWMVGSLVDRKADLTLVAEYARHEDPAPLEVLQNDAYGGLRVELQNAASTRLEAGWMVDLDHGSVVQRTMLSHRIADPVSVELLVQSFPRVSKRDELLAPLQGDDYVEARIHVHL